MQFHSTSCAMARSSKKPTIGPSRTRLRRGGHSGWRRWIRNSSRKWKSHLAILGDCQGRAAEHLWDIYNCFFYLKGYTKATKFLFFVLGVDMRRTQILFFVCGAVRWSRKVFFFFLVAPIRFLFVLSMFLRRFASSSCPRSAQ